MFERTTRVNGSGIANIRRLLSFFAGELDSASKVLSPALVELEQALIVSFLCNNAHNYSAFLESGTRAVASWQVRRAEEYIEARWDQPITIQDLACETSSSARSLFRQFKRDRGQSPMAFLKDVRLRHARDMLARTDVNPSVTETAVACGFGNLGHFATDYFKRFGERPSDTLGRLYVALRPGGHFAIVNWHRQPRERTTVLGEPRGPRTELRMIPEDTIAAVTPARLDLLKVVDLPPYHYAAIFERPSL